MKPSSSKQSSNGRPVKTFKVPPEEEQLLKELMAKLELNFTDVVLRGIRRLAELEGLRQKPAHRAKRSFRSN